MLVIPTAFNNTRTNIKPSINVFCSFSLFIESVGMTENKTSACFCHSRELVPEIKEYVTVTTWLQPRWFIKHFEASCLKFRPAVSVESPVY
jgi:hypothetical protein